MFVIVEKLILIFVSISPGSTDSWQLIDSILKVAFFLLNVKKGLSFIFLSFSNHFLSKFAQWNSLKSKNGKTRNVLA